MDQDRALEKCEPTQAGRLIVLMRQLGHAGRGTATVDTGAERE